MRCKTGSYFVHVPNDCNHDFMHGKVLIKVVVGIIWNVHQQVLIARRPDHTHLGGYWEFPGGKIEPDEMPFIALVRELKEELDIRIADAAYLFTILHTYSEYHVQLSVWKIGRYSGQACGREQQAIRWVEVNDLVDYRFPQANQEILNYLKYGALSRLTEGK